MAPAQPDPPRFHMGYGRLGRRRGRRHLVAVPHPEHARALCGRRVHDFVRGGDGEPVVFGPQWRSSAVMFDNACDPCERKASS